MTAKKAPSRLQASYAAVYKRESGTDILSPAALKRATEIARSKEESLAFLQRAGILTKTGKLAKPYR